jgi:hypothetical protein
VVRRLVGWGLLHCPLADAPAGEWTRARVRGRVTARARVRARLIARPH